LDDNQIWNLVQHGRVITNKIVYRMLLEIAKTNPNIQPRLMHQNLKARIEQEIPELVKDVDLKSVRET